MDDVQALLDVSHRFGPGAGRRKRTLLERVVGGARLGARDRARLADALEFLRAHPDDPATRAAVLRAAARMPRADTAYAYSYAVLVRLVRLFPGALEIAWEDVEDTEPLGDALESVMLPGERQVLEDDRVSYEQWFAAARPAAASTDLEFLLALFERSSLPEPRRVQLFERCDLPIRYRGPGIPHVEIPVRRVHYQRRPLERPRTPLAAMIRRPLPPFRRAGRRMVDLCLEALCARKLEIYPLIYADDRDVTVARCGRGLEIVLIGVRPEWRSPLEVLYFFLAAKNGVPLGYGPAGSLSGCCEIGVNLFPQFRGGETRWLYGQILRVMHRWLGVDYFLLVRYAMGEGNPEALESGAFWFYRKLGFRPTNPAVEEIARAEEARMAAKPGYRSGRRTLVRLSRTEAYLDLSGGARRPHDFGALSMALGRYLASKFDGDRTRAERRCASRAGGFLNVPASDPVVRGLATYLAMIPDLDRWSAADRRRLARFVRAKASRSEAAAARLSARFPRLSRALHALVP